MRKGAEMIHEPYNVTNEDIDDAIARGEFIWTITTGEHIPVSKLTEDHLRNALRFVSNKVTYFSNARRAFGDELRRRREPVPEKAPEEPGEEPGEKADRDPPGSLREETERETG